MERQTSSSTSEDSNIQLQLINSELELDKLYSERMKKEANMDNLNIDEDLKLPDFSIAGLKAKSFTAKGGCRIVSLKELNDHSFLSLLNRRKYYRLGFARVIWVPLATDLPGEVEIAFLDLRAKEGRQIIDHGFHAAKHSHHFSVFQSVYLHRKELDKFAISVTLKGHEAKYGNDAILGSFRIYWILHCSNISLQHEFIKANVKQMKLINMPMPRDLDTIQNNKNLQQEFPRYSTSEFGKLDIAESSQRNCNDSLNKIKNEIIQSTNEMCENGKLKLTIEMKEQVDFKQPEMDCLKSLIHKKISEDRRHTECIQEDENDKVNPVNSQSDIEFRIKELDLTDVSSKILEILGQKTDTKNCTNEEFHTADEVNLG